MRFFLQPTREQQQDDADLLEGRRVRPPVSMSVMGDPAHADCRPRSRRRSSPTTEAVRRRCDDLATDLAATKNDEEGQQDPRESMSWIF